jgi:hypothetical protein
MLLVEAPLRSIDLFDVLAGPLAEPEYRTVERLSRLGQCIFDLRRRCRGDRPRDEPIALERAQGSCEQGTDAIVRLATIGREGPTGTFQDAAGVIPW